MQIGIYKVKTTAWELEDSPVCYEELERMCFFVDEFTSLPQRFIPLPHLNQRGGPYFSAGHLYNLVLICMFVLEPLLCPAGRRAHICAGWAGTERGSCGIRSV